MPVKKYFMCLFLSLSLQTSYSFPVEDIPKSSSSKGYVPISFDLEVDTATSQQQTHLIDIEFKQKKDRVTFNSDECHFNFNRSDTQSAKRYVANELLKTDDVFAFYIYLNAKNSNKRSKEYFDDISKLNSLQEWIWLESSMTFNVLKSPIDIGAITFTISKYGTRNVWLEWTLPDTCGPNNPIGYYNESNRLISYILNDLIENSTMKDSYLCHRNFDCDTSFIEWCWWITTVWVGYDYNCYPIKTLRDGHFDSILISKTDLSKLLTFVVGLVGYMHPFLWHILESVQLLWSPKTNKRRELRKYYKETSKIEKPYGYVRVLQKIFFRSDNDFYTILSFFAFSTLVLSAFNLFKLLNIRHEMFEENGYDNFPNVYRFGVPEYTSIDRSITFTVSVFAYFVCNVWIYRRYNKYDKEFIICIPNNILGRSWRVDPDKRKNNSTTKKNASDGESDKEKSTMKKFNASEKLVHRFTLLFSKNFWNLVLVKSYESPYGLTKWKKYIYVLVFFPMTVLVFIINSILNIVFCTLPALWFVFLLPNILYDEIFRKCKTTTTCLSVSEDNCIASSRTQLRNTIEYICELVLYLLYLFTLREQIGFCVFLLRSLCYTIIFGLIAPDFVMRVFIILVASLGYFLSYVLNYIDLYSILLQLVFKIQEAETKSKKDEATPTSNSERSTIQQNDVVNQEVTSQSTLEENEGAKQKVQSQSSTTEENGDEITETLFNYIVDNCSMVKRSLFVLVVKTFMTCIFLTVTLLILRDTGKLQNLNFNEIVPFLVVLISPKVVSIFTAYKTEDDIERHKGEVENLIKEYHKIKAL